ncbi:MAG: class I SAM-dependent methyltransferase [Cyclobacteriaceae bacterium]
MSKDQFKHSYNDRLFGSGLRRLIHESRYLWVQKKIKNQKLKTILELGCFDGKLLEYLPQNPATYDGFDANWENGLDLAKEKWRKFPNFNFVESTNLTEFKPNLQSYDLTICMETLEHVPDKDVPGYLKILATYSSNDCLITVPNEIGIFLLLKTIYKKIKGTDTESYSIRELFFGIVGNVKKVKRNPGGHKGFSHKVLLNQMQNDFEILNIDGLPFSWLPTNLNPTIGIVARRKEND